MTAEIEPPPTEQPRPVAPPKRSALSTWWPIIAVVLMVAVVATVAFIRFGGSDSDGGFENEGFTADFPSEPEKGTSNFSFGGSSVQTDVYMSAVGTDAVGVGVTDVDIDDADVASVLDEASKFSVRALGLKVTERKALTVDGDRALDVTAKGEEEIFYRSRLLYHEGRVYQLIGIGTNGKVPDAYTTFVESFRLT